MGGRPRSTPPLGRAQRQTMDFRKGPSSDHSEGPVNVSNVRNKYTPGQLLSVAADSNFYSRQGDPLTFSKDRSPDGSLAPSSAEPDFAQGPGEAVPRGYPLNVARRLSDCPSVACIKS